MNFLLFPKNYSSTFKKLNYFERKAVIAKSLAFLNLVPIHFLKIEKKGMIFQT